LVRRSVRVTHGTWPGAGEVLVGRLAATKVGVSEEALGIGKKIEFEGRSWNISGHFDSGGTAYESELWCNLGELQTATKRQDISLVALLLASDAKASAIQLFCKERTDLELRAIPETEYYASLQKHYRPVKFLAWMVVLLVSASGVFAGLNMMYGAVAGRVRELATLQAIGYKRRAILLSILQEGVLLAATSSLISAVLAMVLLRGLSVRFTMGAFALEIDSAALIIGCCIGLLLGILGSLPPSLRALRLSVATSLKAV